ncbi:hypothetical protein NDU88_004722 [Pleurodeles waltl]|uniref:Uncharacterized protein n=1 Tax=Pleurodeles waltl TaxID=8319 RepID=A0AAV7NN42_PLEWA|nr:hypothetical protein NDU88_004722 [Pleurodeles waltl]
MGVRGQRFNRPPCSPAAAAKLRRRGEVSLAVVLPFFIHSQTAGGSAVARCLQLGDGLGPALGPRPWRRALTRTESWLPAVCCGRPGHWPHRPAALRGEALSPVWRRRPARCCRA